jgi:hypothetical protein
MDRRMESWMKGRTVKQRKRKTKKKKRETFEIYTRREEVLAVSTGKWIATQNPAMKLI